MPDRSKNKAGRPAKGQLDWRWNAKLKKDHWHVRITLRSRKRSRWIPLDPDIPESDRAAAEAGALLVSDRARGGDGVVGDAIRESFAEYSKRWADEREARGLRSVRSDRYRLAHHVTPTLGPLDPRAFTRDDVERLRDGLDRSIVGGRMAWKTAANVWTLVTTICGDMVNAKRRDFRVRSDNPSRDVKPPERGVRKAKQYLYPSEFLALVSCPDVPLSWRRAVAIAVYTFARDGELRALRWDAGDLDLEHGVLSITKAYNTDAKRVASTKTGHTRRFAIEANLLPLLSVMKKEARKKGALLTLDLQGEMARRLRKHLITARVERPELHKGSPSRKPLTFHDLRATGITWMAVRGDDPLKIKQRAGHTTFQTTEGYIREAEAIREGFGAVFPPLPAALLDPLGVSDGVSDSDTDEGENALFPGPAECERRDLNPKQESSGSAEKKAESTIATPSSESETVRGSGPMAGPSRHSAAPNPEPTAAQLEAAIVSAVTAGAFDVARVLAAQLEERRRARAGNVIELVPRRRP